MQKIKENTVLAKNQVEDSQLTFFLGNPEGEKRIVIMGNSITRHGIKPEIGWNGLYGMAASREENDYVHLLAKDLDEDKKSYFMMIKQAAEWEIDFENYNLDEFRQIKEFNADVIIFMLGENINRSAEKELLAEKIENLIRYVNQKNAPVIYTTCFWQKSNVDEAIRMAVGKTNNSLIELGDLGDRSEMKALGLFKHKGVAAHPGDKGMKFIAQRIYDKIRELI